MTITSKHTPGPWVVEDRWNVAGQNYTVANGSVCVRDDYESDANARLIAASPDLLAALKDCLAFLDADCAHMPSANPERAVARAAIAKAQGDVK